MLRTVSPKVHSVLLVSNAAIEAEETLQQLEQERKASEDLRSRVALAEKEASDGAAKSKDLVSRASTLEDKCKEQVRLFEGRCKLPFMALTPILQERELQLTKGAVEDYKAEAEQAARRVRELEEQIESDDRAERAEAALQNVQDRATELELQLSKLKQVCTSLDLYYNNISLTHV